MSIIFNESTKTFYLENGRITYAMRINAGHLAHLYFGAYIPCDDILYTVTGGSNPLYVVAPDGYIHEGNAPEINTFGNGDYREPTLHVQNDAGDRICELFYLSHEIVNKKPQISNMPSLDGGETLIIHMGDKVSDFYCDLYYTVYDDCDVIARRTVYKNGANTPVKLLRAYSFTLELPDKDYRALTLYGSWARERAVQITPMLNGVIQADSKRTSPSHTANPFMAVLAKDANENYGDVFGISLIYSSSFVLKMQGTHSGDTLITGGINDFDFSWTLEAGESLESPEVAIASSANGLGDMSRAFHDLFRDHLINKNFVRATRPIVINNWEGTGLDFDEEKLKAIIDGVEGTGINTFVLDDGWFGERNTFDAALGDWFVNKKKLPNGLSVIADYAHSKGIRFGLWFEPEMVSEKSELYKAHPDWAIHVDGREHSHGRDQLVLDITRADVRDYIVEVINKAIRENKVDYVKWDSNRFVSGSCSALLPKEKQMEFHHRYALGLYDILDRIVYANPDVFFEGCSGGGGRFDPAMLYYFPQIWTSDNSDAQDRTLIQYGTSMVYPPSSMSCHVTASPNHSTKRSTAFGTRGDIAALGAFGYELDASTFTDEDRANAKAQIEEYNAWNADLVLSGDLYRIADPFNSNYFGQALVSKDKSRGVLVIYRRVFYYNAQMKHFKMAGLDENKNYYVKELNRVLSGKTLMNVGIVPTFSSSGDFATAKLHFEERN